mmetsp:Transcript_108362/g.212343  ORF Transcript_108362/g.212343 Transcript_108362/m.212343 type:complete len:257 (+) Transcript_108362:231-1001(+)
MHMSHNTLPPSSDSDGDRRIWTGLLDVELPGGCERQERMKSAGCRGLVRARRREKFVKARLVAAARRQVVAKDLGDLGCLVVARSLAAVLGRARRLRRHGGIEGKAQRSCGRVVARLKLRVRGLGERYDRAAGQGRLGRCMRGQVLQPVGVWHCWLVRQKQRAQWRGCNGSAPRQGGCGRGVHEEPEAAEAVRVDLFQKLRVRRRPHPGPGDRSIFAPPRLPDIRGHGRLLVEAENAAGLEERARRAAAAQGTDVL